MAVTAVTAAPVFDALGDPHRLSMVIWLCDAGPSSTTAVTQSVPVTRQAAAKHLTLLESAGVVSSAKRGRERIWTVRPKPSSMPGTTSTRCPRNGIAASNASGRWSRTTPRDA